MNNQKNQKEQFIAMETKKKSSGKRRMLAMIQSLRLLSESNLERIERIEDKMNAFGNQALEMTEVSDENKRRITEMEALILQQQRQEIPDHQAHNVM